MASFDLRGKSAVVTGGNGGIGLGMAKGLAEAGANIAVAARNQTKSQTAVAELKSFGVDAIALTLDVNSEDACHDVINQAAKKFGSIDILINNAGTNIRKNPEELSLSEWHTVLDTNLTSAFICSQAVYPHMCKAGGGKIINIGSMMSIFGAPFTTAYAASKGGIVQMTKAMATAWAKDKIQVNSVLPGWINTELTQIGRQQIDGLHETVLNRTPAGRWGEPEDMAGIAVFLASQASDFLTGTAIPLDGGFSVQI
jgi:2-deoxy-D-gluconate 3-dehydrogenase